MGTAVAAAVDAFSPADQGDGTNDSDDPAGVTATVTQGTLNDVYDFGYVLQTATIGDRVWLDEDGNVVGEFCATGVVPKFADQLKRRGFPLDLKMFRAFSR